MKRELEELLFSRYPKILEGCQQEGLGIADGWFTLVDTLCRVKKKCWVSGLNG